MDVKQGVRKGDARRAPQAASPEDPPVTKDCTLPDAVLETDNLHITILLATYNGQNYLQDQLRSIELQTHPNWSLYVSDDGSTDGTLDILREFAQRNPGRVYIQQTSDQQQSARDNFLTLLFAVKLQGYLAFCDQDDVWDSHKLTNLLRTCLQVEVTSCQPSPTLIFSDLAVTDRLLCVSADSFMSEIRTDPHKITFEQLLVENSIPGCSMLFNKELLQIVQCHNDKTEAIIMHDWWIALIAAGCGRLGYVAEPLVLYRQHGANQAGSQRRYGIEFAWNKLVSGLSVDPNRQSIAQANLLRSVHGSRLHASHAAALEAYCKFPQMNKTRRIMTSFRHGIMKQTIARKIYQVVTM